MAGQELILTTILTLSLTNNTQNDIYTQNNKPTLEEQAIMIKGQNLTVVTSQNYPLSYVTEENGTLVGRGISFIFLKLLQDKYGFNYNVILPEDDILGTESTGIFGTLNMEKADLAVAFLPVIREGQQFVQYSRNLDTGEWVVLMKRPKESAQGSGLLAPFTLGVWLLILVSLVAVGPIIYAIILLRVRLCPMDEKNRKFPLPSCVWFVYGALLKQGSTLSPISDSSRLLFATWWIFITILTAFYTANLTAFLTLSNFKLPIESSADIVKYKWVTRKGNAIENAAFDIAETHTRVEQGEFVTINDTEILESFVNKKQYLFLQEKPTVEHLMYNDYLDKSRKGVAEADRCTFVVTDWSVIVRARAFAYSKSFKYTDLFDHTLQYLVEAGIVKHKLRDGLPDAQICPLNLKNKERQLRNSDLFTTYVVIFMGFGISGTVFIGEVIYRYWNRFCKCKIQTNSNDQINNNHKEKIFQHNYVIPPPPSYQTLFGHKHTEKKVVNGRDYWVFKNMNGDTTLIPVRTPSALLFQYTH